MNYVHVGQTGASTPPLTIIWCQLLQSSIMRPLAGSLEPVHRLADGGIAHTEMVGNLPHRVNAGEEGADHCFAALSVGALEVPER